MKLVEFLSDRLTLPLSEIKRQIELGFVRIEGKPVTNPHIDIDYHGHPLYGMRIEVGQTKVFEY